MSNSFSIKTLWRSFFCALVATVTLSVGLLKSFNGVLNIWIGHESIQDWKAGVVPSHVRSRLAFLRNRLLRDNWNLWGQYRISETHNSISCIIQGLYGAFVIKFNLQVAAFRRKYLANHGVMEAVTLATLTAMIGFFNRFLRLDMTESLYILFRECEGGGDYGGLCQYVSPFYSIFDSKIL